MWKRTPEISEGLSGDKFTGDGDIIDDRFPLCNTVPNKKNKNSFNRELLCITDKSFCK